MMDIYYLLFPEVTEKLHQRFIDTGVVPEPTINHIARKIAKNIKLNDMELNIFYSKTTEINEAIKCIKS
jgi:hypothetical protein